MATVKLEESHFTDIANSIRQIKGTNDTYKPGEMANAIAQTMVNEDPIARAIIQKTGVTSLCIPDATYINQSAFENMFDLVTLDLPDATYLGSGAMNGCIKLKTVILRSHTVCDIYGSETMGDVINNADVVDTYVYVPSDMVDAYKSDSHYSDFVHRIRAIEDYPHICG